MPQLLITIAAGIAGFILARKFVRSRLRFVDAVHSPIAPLVAGCLAAMVTWPAVLLPLVTLTTTLVFGIGTGLGTASGARDIRDGEGRRRIAP
jgi:CHASE2 domain-containing sensor protein